MLVQLDSHSMLNSSLRRILSKVIMALSRGVPTSFWPAAEHKHTRTRTHAQTHAQTQTQTQTHREQMIASAPIILGGDAGKTMKGDWGEYR